MDFISKKSRIWAKANPEKRHAHSILWTAILRGKIVKPDTCSKCKSKRNIQAHHTDYSRPLEVIWLCASCHKYADRERRLHE